MASKETVDKKKEDPKPPTPVVNVANQGQIAGVPIELTGDPGVQSAKIDQTYPEQAAIAFTKTPKSHRPSSPFTDCSVMDAYGLKKEVDGMIVTTPDGIRLRGILSQLLALMLGTDALDADD